MCARQIRDELRRDLSDHRQSRQLLAQFEDRLEALMQRGKHEDEAALQAAWEIRVETGKWPPEPGDEQAPNPPSRTEADR